jgi:Cu/Ag efflux pump CusA
MLSRPVGASLRPLATAFLLAVGLSLLVAMSATPALCALLMQDYAPRSEPGWLRRCKAWQQRVIGALAPRARLVLMVVLLSGLLGLALLPVLGARLLPDFRENYLIAHAALRPGISLAETSRVGERIAARLAGIAGVKSVAEQIGRAENV